MLYTKLNQSHYVRNVSKTDFSTVIHFSTVHGSDFFRGKLRKSKRFLGVVTITPPFFRPLIALSNLIFVT